ncbi:hypothetical protein HU200_014622 [Digitaria exilis]|uniref:Uncharacterized protein n=1 Tax=Digitaria exilis TaxID=1010633 RepID=A0A835FBI6_9POAL|nr:hypothetical protein HU200_014622 [Digitaria exilis]
MRSGRAGATVPSAMARPRPRPQAPPMRRRRQGRLAGDTAAGRCCSRTRSSCGVDGDSSRLARRCLTGANGRRVAASPAATSLWCGR